MVFLYFALAIQSRTSGIFYVIIIISFNISNNQYNHCGIITQRYYRLPFVSQPQELCF